MNTFFEIIFKKEVYMAIISIVIYILIGYAAYSVIKNLLIKSLKNKKKRQHTITKLLINTIKIFIIILEMIIILKQIGIDVTSLLAGLGIASVVLGLALQDIMKDILSGINIIIDDEYDIDDLVEINNFLGLVISIGLKTTKIKGFDGTIKMIANRSISEVTNYSKTKNIAILDIPIPYEENLNKTEKILNKIVKRAETLDEVVGEVKILGVNEFAASSINYRLVAESKPSTYYIVLRKIRKIVLEEFNSSNISIPYNKIEVINGNKL